MTIRNASLKVLHERLRLAFFGYFAPAHPGANLERRRIA